MHFDMTKVYITTVEESNTSVNLVCCTVQYLLDKIQNLFQITPLIINIG